MIKVSIKEATDDDPIKKIIFTNSLGFEFKTLYFDKENNFIYELFIDFNYETKDFVSYIFAGNDYKLIAYQKRYASTATHQRTDDYLLVDDEFKIMSTVLTEIINNFQGIKISNFDMNGDLFYYQIINSELGQVQGYNANDEKIYIFEDIQNEYHKTFSTLSIELLTGKISINV